MTPPIPQFASWRFAPWHPLQIPQQSKPKPKAIMTAHDDARHAFVNQDVAERAYYRQVACSVSRGLVIAKLQRRIAALRRRNLTQYRTIKELHRIMAEPNKPITEQPNAGEDASQVNTKQPTRPPQPPARPSSQRDQPRR